ncbi:MAG: WD40 repeat domain-containing protein, partial [Chthoniobacteraceae bacterium]|nr:WD40 repeat domain-containing protein [Chthoniobacteraceae bacterium]
SVLWGALESFAEDELLAVTGLAPAVWSSILNALEGSLISNGGRIAFGHDYLRKSVEDRYVAGNGKQSAIMRRLADFCAERMRTEGRKANSPYVRRQAVRHFIIADQWDEAVAALSDLEFIRARALTLELPEMLIDFSDLAVRLPEGEAERARDAMRQADLDRYASERAQQAAAWSRILNDSGEAKLKTPRPVAAVLLRSTSEVALESKRITEVPSPLDVLKAFRVFVATNADPLERYSSHDGFTETLARNGAPAGPVHEEGNRLLERLPGVKLLRNFAPEETYNPLPACVAILGEHESLITCLAFSLDGRRIFSGSRDGTIRIWDANTGQCLHVLEGHMDGVQSMALSADGCRLVSLCSVALRLWDTDTGEILKLLENKEEWDVETGEIIDFSEWHPDGASSVAISADGRWIVSGGVTIRVWDSETLELRSVLEGHTDQVQTLCFFEDENCIVSASDDESIRVWDLNQGLCLRRLEGNFNAKAVALAADGTLVASVEKALHTFDIRTGNLLRILEGHESGVTALALNPEGTLLISGSYDKSLRVWDLRTGDCLRIRAGLHVRTVALSADGARAVSSGRDREIWVWDVENGYWHKEAPPHENRVNTLSLHADGERLLSASTDRTVRLWNPDLSQCLSVFEGHQSPVCCAIFSAGGNRIVSGDSDNALRIWDSSSGECLGVYEGYRGPDDDSAMFTELLSSTADALVFSGSLQLGERAVDNSAPREGMVIQTWDSETGRRLNVFHQREPWVLSMAQGANSREILSGSNDGTVRIWDTETGECLQVFAGHQKAVMAAKFSPDGARIVSGDEDGILRIWDRKSGECLRILEGHGGGIESLAFNPDGTRILSCSSRGMLGIWDEEHGTCLGVFFLRGLSCVTLDGEWRRIFAGFADGSLRTYRLEFPSPSDGN